MRILFVILLIVGYSCKINAQVVQKESNKYQYCTPKSKEAYYYRTIFEEIFPSNEAALTVESGPSIACSSPIDFQWSKDFEKMDDPSGRAIDIHNESVKSI